MGVHRALRLFAPPAVFAVGLSLLAPTAGLAVGFTVAVPSPNGVDDTANLQAGLNACVAHGPNCTVQLGHGRYLTRQLVTYNFQRTFKGLGMNATTIEALPNLSVSAGDLAIQGECPPNTTTCPWPSLITATKVIRNNLNGFTTTGPARIYLDNASAQNLVVCSTFNDTVLNLATGNQINGAHNPQPRHRHLLAPPGRVCQDALRRTRCP